MPETPREYNKVVEALRASEQCIEDFLDVYKRGCSMLVMDEAVKDLRDDALRSVKAALRLIGETVPTQQESEKAHVNN